ncbi:MAG: hypothetical protein ACLQGP_23035 [Isosphaeraceae bacterium]
MTDRAVVSHRLQFSMRSLLIATAILAVLLVPLAWVARQRQQMQHQMDQMQQAREEAIRAVILAERYRKIEHRSGNRGPSVVGAEPRGSSWRNDPVPAESAARIERLERENDELKDTIEILRGEVERLKDRIR